MQCFIRLPIGVGFGCSHQERSSLQDHERLALTVDVPLFCRVVGRPQFLIALLQLAIDGLDLLPVAPMSE